MLRQGPGRGGFDQGARTMWAEEEKPARACTVVRWGAKVDHTVTSASPKGKLPAQKVPVGLSMGQRERKRTKGTKQEEERG